LNKGSTTQGIYLNTERLINGKATQKCTRLFAFDSCSLTWTDNELASTCVCVPQAHPLINAECEQISTILIEANAVYTSHVRSARYEKATYQLKNLSMGRLCTSHVWLFVITKPRIERPYVTATRQPSSITSGQILLTKLFQPGSIFDKKRKRGFEKHHKLQKCLSKRGVLPSKRSAHNPETEFSQRSNDVQLRYARACRWQRIRWVERRPLLDSEVHSRKAKASADCESPPNALEIYGNRDGNAEVVSGVNASSLLLLL